MNGNRRGGTPAVRVLAAVVGALAVIVPPRRLAVVLVGSRSPLLDEVIAGVWCVKGLLALHALLLLVLPRWAPGGGSGEAGPRRAAPGRPAGRDRVWDGALVALVAVALAVRLLHLGEGLWFDEIWTLLHYVDLPWGRLLVTFDTQNQHFLYSLSAKAAMALPLGRAAALRLPAALFGAGSIAALYVLGTCVANRREAFLAAAVLAFSSHHVWFSQNARGYTGVLFWTLLSTWLFVRMLRAGAGGWKLPLLYATTSALAVYTHLTAALTVVAHGLVFAARELRAARRGGARAGLSSAPVIGLLLAATFSLQLYALVLPQLPRTLVGSGGGDAAASVAWTSPAWLVSELLAGLARGVPGGAISLVAVGAVGVLGLVSYWRRDATLVGLMIVPALSTALVMMATRHNLWPRFFFASTGFAALIGVRGVFEATRLLRIPAARKVATATLGLAAAVSALTIPRVWGPKQDHEGAAAYVDRLLQPGDAVVVLDMTEVPFEQYLGRTYQSVRTREELLEIERRHARTWLLYSFPTRLSAEYPGIWDRVRSEYREVTSFPGTVEGGAVVLTRRG